MKWKFACGRRKKYHKKTQADNTADGGVVNDVEEDEVILPDDRYIRVLIAEDNSISLAIMQRMLSLRNNITVETVGDGARALELVASRKTDPFSLIILDVHMPGLNGIEVVKGIRKRNIDIPILVVTADETMRARCLRAGADAVLFKPVKRAILLHNIDELICPVGLEEVQEEPSN